MLRLLKRNKMADTKDDKNKSLESGKMIAVVLVRGIIGVRRDVMRTFEELNLTVKNTAIFLPDNDPYKGMVLKVKDFVAFGISSEEFAKEVGSKRKDFSKKKGIHKFHLNPPRKGFGRRGIKTPYTMSGALGDRREKIEELIRRMI